MKLRKGFRLLTLCFVLPVMVAGYACGDWCSFGENGNRRCKDNVVQQCENSDWKDIENCGTNGKSCISGCDGLSDNACCQ